MSILQKFVRSSFVLAKKVVMSNRTLRSLLYETGDMFEGVDYHEVMLADPIRMDAYAEGLRRTVKPGDVVADFGAGTGILSMLAAQHKPRKVYAVEHHGIIEVGKRLAERNGLNSIEFVHASGRDFTPPEKVDLIIHEQLGDYLFEENMIDNLLEFKARVLKPGGKIFPSKFELFLEPAALKREYRVPFAWEHNFHGIDFSSLKTDEVYHRFNPKKDATRTTVETNSLEFLLCEPEPILSFDLNEMTSKDDLPKSITKRRTVVRAGAVDGLSLYFKAIFDKDLSFDTALSSPHTHWQHPFYRTQRRELKAGDAVTVSLKMGEISDASSWSTSLQ